MNKEDILKAFNYRHACKEFDINKKISEEDFSFIIETARLSPSSFGFEPWHLLVVQNRDLRNKLKEFSWGASLKLDTASHFVLCLTLQPAYMKYDSEYLNYFMKNVKNYPDDVIDMMKEYFKNFQKDDFDLNTERSLFDWASKQSYIAMGNMMTSAAMINIDSCPIEGFNKKKIEEILKNDFNIDTSKYGISYMLAFGYRVNDAPEKTRRNTNELISWEN